MNANLLRGCIIAKGFSLQTFSEAVRIKRTALYRKLIGKTEFSCSEISRIILTLDLTTDQIMSIFFSQQVS